MTAEWPELGPSLNDSGGDFHGYIEDCYAQYEEDFYGGDRPWPVPGQRLQLKRQPVDEDGKCNTFWHIVTEGAIEAERLPDLHRCERIAWPKELLREFNATYPARSSARVVWWMTRRQSENRYVISLTDFSYVVVVADRGSYVLLWTAYPVEHHRQRQRLQRQFDEYWRGRTSPAQ